MPRPDRSTPARAWLSIRSFAWGRAYELEAARLAREIEEAET